MKRTSAKKNERPRHERGVALVLVIFFITLASIIVVNLAYSTYIGSRLSASVERSLQAEYLLKSALNVARVLIKEDQTPTEDTPIDPWRFFLNGVAIPGEWLGISEVNVRVELEIRPEESKFPLRALVSSSGTVSSPLERRAQEILSRLFKQLQFDQDKEEDQTGLFPKMVFNSDQLVAILVDYMDADKDSYQDGVFSGVEDQIPDGSFPNRQISRVGELSAIPGFTPARVRALLPYVTAGPTQRVNINNAPPLLMKALHPDFEAAVDQIIAFRTAEEGPFKSVGDLDRFLPSGSTALTEIQSLLAVYSNQFQVLAKVDYETSSYFMRAYLGKQTGKGDLPKVQSIELF